MYCLVFQQDNVLEQELSNGLNTDDSHILASDRARHPADVARTNVCASAALP